MRCQRGIGLLLVAAVVLVSGACNGSSSATKAKGSASPPLSSGTHAKKPSSVVMHVIAGVSVSIVSGRAFTSECAPRLSSKCVATPYRGYLNFCSSMNQIGPCPVARVEASGRFTIDLRPGTYALLPAPGRNNVVAIKPRWVSVTAPRTLLEVTGSNTGN